MDAGRQGPIEETRSMNSDLPLFQRAKALFAELLELSDAERSDRLSRLEQQDPGAAAEVRRLLEHAPADTARFEPVLKGASRSLELGVVRFQPGDRIAERYRLERRLGSGGMGEVFLAHDDLLDQSVALKCWLGEPWHDESARFERLVAEAQLARRIEHANVCRVFDVGLHRGTRGDELFLTLEYVPGSDLAEHLKLHGPMAAESVRALATQLCGALAAIHSQGILHRDLKPANVLLDGQGRARVTDFGIAVDDRRDGAWAEGTPAYLAPELRAGQAPAEASDLYALGLVLREAAGADEPPPDLDPVVARIIERCLAPDPADRPESAALLVEVLAEDDALAAAVKLGEPPSPAMIARAQSVAVLDHRRARMVAGLSWLGLLLVIVFGARIESFAAAGLDHSADELAERARALADAVAPDRDMVKRVWGFTEIEGERFPENPYPRGLAQAGGDVFFWYREARFELANWNVLDLLLNGGRVHLMEPPIASIATLSMGFDARGRLFLFYYHPVRLWDPSTVAVGESDWSLLFDAARLDPEPLAEAEPSSIFAAVADHRRTLSDPADKTLVELGTLAGRPVLFAAMEQGVVDEALLARQTLSSQYQVIATPLFVLIVLFFARRHWRSGLGDPWGAGRLATFVCVVGYVAFVLQADHLRDPVDEALFLVAGLSGPLIQALVVWTLYMGCEPWVRQHWPRSLVSWNRLLKGNRAAFVDPAVASHLLLGIGFGVLFMAARLSERALTAWLRGDALPLPAGLPLGIPQLRHGLSQVLQTPFDGIWVALLFAVVLAWGRRLVPRPWLADTCAVLVLSFGTVLGAAEPWASVLLYALPQVALACRLAVRQGLLVLVTAKATVGLMAQLPVVPNDAFPWAAPMSLGLLMALSLWCLWVLGRILPRNELRGHPRQDTSL